MSHPSKPMNPWLANAIVFAGFLVVVALAYGIYWWWSGGREKMVAPPERFGPTAPARERAPSREPPVTPSTIRWREYREAIARGEALDPLPFYLRDLEDGSEAERIAAIDALAGIDRPEARAAIERAAATDASEKVRDAARAARGAGRES